VGGKLPETEKPGERSARSQKSKLNELPAWKFSGKLKPERLRPRFQQGTHFQRRARGSDTDREREREPVVGMQRRHRVKGAVSAENPVGVTSCTQRVLPPTLQIILFLRFVSLQDNFFFTQITTILNPSFKSLY